jgi:TonB-linked SusC/RagA family outer membrane protein
LKADANDILVVSYVGFTPKEITVKDERELKIKLAPKTDYLEELIVVGYGEFKREDLTGSVGVTDLQDVAKAPVPDIMQALSGRIAGVQIISNDAQPGTKMEFVIRGANSITQENTPLYVVDGLSMEDFDISTLNTSDIESINILKDASATAIYGSRAANGVVIIETKSGKLGKPVIVYEGSVGFQQVSNRMDMMSPYDFVRYQIDRDYDRMTQMYLTEPNLTIEDYKRLEVIDWQNELFKTSPLISQSLSISGGEGRTRYAASLSNVIQDGIIVNTGYNKTIGRLRLDQTVNDRLRVRLSGNYSQEGSYGQYASEQQQSANAYTTYLMYRVWGYRPVNVGVGDIFEDLYDGEDTFTAIMNPVISSMNEVRKITRKALNTNATIDYSILNNLRLRINAGVRERSILNENFNNSKTYRGYPSANNLKGVNGSYRNQTITQWANENTLTYRQTLKRYHRLDLIGGATFESDKRSIYGYEVINVPHEEMGLAGMDQGIPYSVRSSPQKNTLASFLGRVNYNYRSRYMLTLSFRADGSSKFSKNNRWGYYPSGAFAWNMGREPFMKKNDFISESKLRFSYGQTGNNRINEDARYRTIDIGDYYSFDNGTPEYALVLQDIGNKDLKWERTDQIDLGYDLSLFDNRLNFVIDLYQKTTRDLLLRANVPYSSGTRRTFKNVGKVSNRGLEISINSQNLRTQSFTWESNFNISFNRSKILGLTEGEEALLSIVTWTGDWNGTPLYIGKIGHPMAAFYGYVWDGVYTYDDFDVQPDGSYTLKLNVPSNGGTRESIQPGEIKYVDQNGDGIVNDKDRVIIGSPLPIHTGGFNNNFIYKNLSLNVFFQWSYGNKAFNANRLMFEGNSTNRNINQYASYNDRWTPENPTSTLFRVGGQGPRGVYSSRTIEDASYLRLKTVQLSYDVPLRSSLRFISNLQVFVAAQNLYTWTKYSGMDPEVSTRNTALTPGFDYSAYPRNRTLTTGITVRFR